MIKCESTEEMKWRVVTGSEAYPGRWGAGE